MINEMSGVDASQFDFKVLTYHLKLILKEKFLYNNNDLTEQAMKNLLENFENDEFDFNKKNIFIISDPHSIINQGLDTEINFFINNRFRKKKEAKCAFMICTGSHWFLLIVEKVIDDNEQVAYKVTTYDSLNNNVIETYENHIFEIIAKSFCIKKNVKIDECFFEDFCEGILKTTSLKRFTKEIIHLDIIILNGIIKTLKNYVNEYPNEVNNALNQIIEDVGKKYPKKIKYLYECVEKLFKGVYNLEKNIYLDNELYRLRENNIFDYKNIELLCIDFCNKFSCSTIDFYENLLKLTYDENCKLYDNEICNDIFNNIKKYRRLNYGDILRLSVYKNHVKISEEGRYYLDDKEIFVDEGTFWRVVCDYPELVNLKVDQICELNKKIKVIKALEVKRVLIELQKIFKLEKYDIKKDDIKKDDIEFLHENIKNSLSERVQLYNENRNYYDYLKYLIKLPSTFCVKLPLEYLANKKQCDNSYLYLKQSFI